MAARIPKLTRQHFYWLAEILHSMRPVSPQGRISPMWHTLFEDMLRSGQFPIVPGKVDNDINEPGSVDFEKGEGYLPLTEEQDKIVRVYIFEEKLDSWKYIVDRMAAELSYTNSNFDAYRFKYKCGYYEDPDINGEE